MLIMDRGLRLGWGTCVIQCLALSRGFGLIRGVNLCGFNFY
jgi:hypothetical protein